MHMIRLADYWRRVRYWRRPKLLSFLVPLPYALPLSEEDVFAFAAPHSDEEPAVNLFEPAAAVGLDLNRFYVSIRFWHEAAGHADTDRAASVFDAVLRRLWSKQGFRSVNSRRSRRRTLPTDTAELKFVSVAEISTVFSPADAEWREARPDPDSDPVSDAFDFALIFLDRIIRAHRVSADKPLARVSLEQLPFYVPVIVRTATKRKGFIDGMSIFVLHAEPPVVGRPEVMDEPSFTSLHDHLAAQVRKHPFFGYRERFLEARTALAIHGDYSRAVVEFHTATEILLGNLLTLMLWEEGMTPEEAAGSVFSKRLKPRIRQYYHPRLGGNWDTTGVGAVGKWAQICSHLRNQVVHTGYEVTRVQAHLCLDLTKDLELYVADLVAKRTSRYPRVALLLLGEPGLRRRGVWTASLSALAHDPNEPNWIAAHEAWRIALETIEAG